MATEKPPIYTTCLLAKQEAQRKSLLHFQVPHFAQVPLVGWIPSQPVAARCGICKMLFLVFCPPAGRMVRRD